MSNPDKQTLKVGKWGNNLAIRFDKELSLRYNLEKDSKVELEHMDGGFFLRPLTNKPQPKISLMDVKYGEEVSIDPKKIQTIHLQNTPNDGYIFRVATRVVKVSISLDSMFKLKHTLDNYFKLSQESTLIICIKQLTDANSQAEKQNADIEQLLNLWEQCGIVWKQGVNPLKDPDFLSRMSMMRSQMNLI